MNCSGNPNLTKAYIRNLSNADLEQLMREADGMHPAAYDFALSEWHDRVNVEDVDVDDGAF